MMHQDTALIREVSDLIAEANVLAGRYSSSEDSQRERAAFRDRKAQLLDRLNVATSPTILAAEREAGR